MNYRNWRIFFAGIFLMFVIYGWGRALLLLWTSYYGAAVQGRVVNNEDVCRLKRKSVTVVWKGRQEKLRITGIRCRMDEFRKDSLVTLRYNKTFNLLLIPQNQYPMRVVFYTVLLVAALLSLWLLRKKWWPKGRSIQY